MDCRLGHKYQRGVCDFCVMHLREGVAAGGGYAVRPRMGKDRRVVSC